MKQQINSLDNLMTALSMQAADRHDYIVDTRNLRMSDAGSLTVRGQGGQYSPTDHAGGQIASRLGIPQKYYQRMLAEAPALLAHNVNTWFDAQPEKRMIRTLGTSARAFMSNRYRIMDHGDILMPALQGLKDTGVQAEFRSIGLTSTKMQIKVSFPQIRAEIVRGDIVESGLLISNSEVGAGSFNLALFVYRVLCTNGMRAMDFLNQFHLGQQQGANEDQLLEVYSDETLRLTDGATAARIRDLVGAAANRESFDKLVVTMQESAGKAVENPTETVELVAKKHGLTEVEKADVLKNWITSGSLTQWGLVNAVTRTAEDAASYDRASELEALGGRLLLAA